MGKYNPDWAVAFREGSVKHVYFVAKSKGNDLHGSQLRGSEESKIEYVRCHFKDISNNGNIVINGVEYAPYCAEGYHFIVNYSDGVELSAEALYEEIADVLNRNSKDEIVLKVIGKKLYGVIEEENIFGKVVAAKDGKIDIELMDDYVVEGIAADFKVGDRVFGFYNEKTKAFELSKVEPTAIVNVAVDTQDPTAVKYFFEKVGGTEFKIGAASILLDYYYDFEPEFVKNETAYWALYIVDGYCLEAVKTEKVQEKDLFVIAKSVVYNTTNNTTTYTFTLNTKADGKGDAYTFVKVVNGNDAHLDKIVAKDTVIYSYDAQTLAAISIQEFKTIEAKTEKVLANEALGNVDTVCATAASVIEALALAAAETDVEFRIVLPAKNGGATKAPIAGQASQEAEIVAGANVVMDDYQFVTLASAV